MLTMCYYHVTYVFQGKSILYNCLNVKEILARNRRDIGSLSDSNGIRTRTGWVFTYGLSSCIFKSLLLSLIWRIILHHKNKINSFRRNSFMVCRKVRQILQYHLSNKRFLHKNFAHHMLLFLYLFKNEKQLLSPSP